MDLTTITITASTILSLFGGNAGEGKFLYKTNFTEDQTISEKTIFEKKTDNGCYSPKYQYKYMYDEAKRLSQKEVQTWNASLSKWENSHCLTYTYEDDEYTIASTKWNEEKQAYADLTEKNTYQLIDNDVLCVSNYKWDDSKNSWAFVSRVATYDPTNEFTTFLK